MKFEKIRYLLQKYDIKFIEAGKNVKPGNINIKCPLCKDDASYHMGINLQNGWYGCWRDSRHRGKNLFYLLSSVLGLPADVVKSMLPRQSRCSEAISAKKGASILVMPQSFLDPLETGYNVQRFDNYLKYRGFDDTELFIKKYGVRYCLTGEWADRIIFPLYDRNTLVAFHTRSIFRKEFLPYRDSSIEASITHPKKFLWDYNRLQEGGEVLYITEGIFDALKIDFFTGDKIKATCIFTKTIREEQVLLLYKMKDLYSEIRLCLDADALPAALVIRQGLSFFGDKLRIAFLPDGKKDPGEMTEKEIKAWIK